MSTSRFKIATANDRRTNVDSVYDYLYEEITTMRLLPGAKLSEAEIAKLFEISRQPVRDAFSRLENQDLLLIRPQIGEVAYAADVISECKATVDRLCLLGLSREEQLEQLLDDHTNIASSVARNDVQGAVDAGMSHLTRLDNTIAAIREEHADFFDD